MNFLFQFFLCVGFAQTGLCSFIYGLVFLLLLPLSKKKDPAIIIYKVHYLSENDARKCYLRCVARKWLLGLHAKRSAALRITFWDGFPYDHVPTFFATGS